MTIMPRKPLYYVCIRCGAPTTLRCNGIRHHEGRKKK